MKSAERIGIVYAIPFKSGRGELVIFIFPFMFGFFAIYFHWLFLCLHYYLFKEFVHDERASMCGYSMYLRIWSVKWMILWWLLNYCTEISCYQTCKSLVHHFFYQTLYVYAVAFLPLNLFKIYAIFHTKVKWKSRNKFSWNRRNVRSHFRSYFRRCHCCCHCHRRHRLIFYLVIGCANAYVTKSYVRIDWLHSKIRRLKLTKQICWSSR